MDLQVKHKDAKEGTLKL